MNSRKMGTSEFNCLNRSKLTTLTCVIAIHPDQRGLYSSGAWQQSHCLAAAFRNIIACQDFRARAMRYLLPVYAHIHVELSYAQSGQLRQELSLTGSASAVLPPMPLTRRQGWV